GAPRPSPLLPYTTLFRSSEMGFDDVVDDGELKTPDRMADNAAAAVNGVSTCVWPLDPGHLGGTTRSEFEEQQHLQGQRSEKTTRSEEHTSELQSRFDLVC